MLVKYKRVKKGGDVMEYYFCARCGQGPLEWHGGTDILVDNRKRVTICPECKKSFKAWYALGQHKIKVESEE